MVLEEAGAETRPWFEPLPLPTPLAPAPPALMANGHLVPGHERRPDPWVILDVRNPSPMTNLVVNLPREEANVRE